MIINSSDLNLQIKTHWVQLREGTYQLLSNLKDHQLALTLPFKASQNIRYQLHCMCGAQQSNLSLIKANQWLGYSSSLDALPHSSVKDIIKHLKTSDKQMLKIFDKLNWGKHFDDHTTPLTNYLILVEHEAHHQGQLINFIYAHHLPIPKSWQTKWALN